MTCDHFVLTFFLQNAKFMWNQHIQLLHLTNLTNFFCFCFLSYFQLIFNHHNAMKYSSEFDLTKLFSNFLYFSGSKAYSTSRKKDLREPPSNWFDGSNDQETKCQNKQSWRNVHAKTEDFSSKFSKISSYSSAKSSPFSDLRLTKGIFWLCRRLDFISFWIFFHRN